jgi:disulfide oxidoreductase YuzD
MVKTVVLCSIVLLLSCEEKSDCPSERLKNMVYPIRYKGVIKRKYDNNQDHLLHYIDIQNENSLISHPADYLTLKDTSYVELFWYYAEVGDSILKDKNSYDVLIRKQGGSINRKVFTLRCPPVR